MGIIVTPVSNFVRDLKIIAKKHKAVLTDVAKLSAMLKENPTMETSLGQNVYKIRLSISGTNKGKGGARVITYVLIHEEIIYLSEIYLKSEHDTVDANTVIKRLQDQGLI